VTRTSTLFFDAISEPGRKALLDRSVEKRYTAGEMLWNAGETPTGLTVVLEGRVRILRAVNGRLTAIHYGDAGSTLGEIPFFLRSTYPASAVAVEPTRCLIIPYAALDHALHVDSTFAFALLERLSARVEELVLRLGQISSESVKARLSRYILQRASRRGPDHVLGPFSLGMTQDELAVELGTVREVVVRSLRELRESRLISAAGSGRYRVENLEALQKMF
jgi:CRP/FNR family transcriptional regulator